MAQKPKIQYIGQFYVYGSEAKLLEEQHKQAKTKLPKLPRLEKLYIDPVAVGGTLVAFMLLAVLVFGAVKLGETRAEHNRMADYLTTLRTENAELIHQYYASIDMEEVRATAEMAGYVTAEEAGYTICFVTPPEKKPEPTLRERVIAELRELFSGAKREK